MLVFQQIIQNEVLKVSLLSWLVAQILKVFSTFAKEKRIDLIGSLDRGHAEFPFFVCNGAIYSHRFKNGWTSDEYAIAFAFALIVMYDASGVRRAVGKQAIILNQLIKDWQKHKPIKEKQLKELIGHTLSR